MDALADFTEFRPSGDHWVLGGNTLDQQGTITGTNITTWGSTRTLTPANISATWQPVAIPISATPSTPGVGKVLISEIDGVIQDVTDTCNLTPFPTFVSVSSSRNLLAFQLVGGPLPIPVQMFAGAPPPTGLVFDTTMQIVPAGCPCGGGSAVGFCISIYVTQFNKTTGLWEVRIPLVTNSFATKDYEMLLDDSYHLPNVALATPYTGRSWKLRLRRPVIIGAGQALNVSISFDAVLSKPIIAAPLTYRAAFRTRVSDVV